MTKNIWILHHYADPPDGYWTGTYDLYKFLVRKGHRVTVFSSSFSHYSHKDIRVQDGETFHEREYGGMRFVFVKTVPHERNDWRRLLNMLSYGWRAYRIGARFRERPDVVIGTTPHPFAVLAALMLARKKRARFCMELHDLWSEYIRDTKMFARWNPAVLALRWFDRLFYRCAEKIFILWPRMDIYLRKFAVPDKKIVWMPMGLDFERLEPIPAHNGRPLDTMVVMCTARIGPASNIDEILCAAKILKEQRCEQITFALIGEGPEKERLVAFANRHDLRSVEFRGLVPKEAIRSILREADVCIAGLPDLPNYRQYGTIPTKLLDYLTSNRPTVFITSIQDSLVELAKAGFVVPPRSPDKLAETLIRLYRMTIEERTALGKNGFNYMREHHNLQTLSDRLAAELFSYE